MADSNAKKLAQLLDGNGDVLLTNLDNISVTPAGVSDQPNTSTGGLTLPSGTTAQRPSSPDTGESRMNTTIGSLEFYDGSAWIATNLIPSVDSISGNLVSDSGTSITLTLESATETVDIVYRVSGGAELATTTGVAVSGGSATTTVPSAVYGQSAGTVIAISVKNADGTPSGNAVTKTILALPTGGTISASGNNRTHTYTSTSNFVVPSGVTVSAETFILAGGASGGYHSGGGGGAGGLLWYSSSTVDGKAPNAGKLSFGAGTHSCTVGAGAGAAASGGAYPNFTGFRTDAPADGSGGGGSSAPGKDGNNSVVIIAGGATYTANGGGGGGHSGGGGYDGGCGGAGARNRAGGSGTSGQGQNGGNAQYGNATPYPADGGGGCKTAGGGASSSSGGAGGTGFNFSSVFGTSNGDSGNFGGGGGGNIQYDYPSGGGAGGFGGGGAGGGSSEGASGGNGVTQSGSGGGGNRYNASLAGLSQGGSGIIFIRYDKTTL
jgi:hypothetical protein